MSALVKLYPAAFRREFGDEVADAYRQATQGASRPARMLEAVNVVGHALRLRLGLGSAGRAGQLLAALAPFAAVAVGAAAMSWARMWAIVVTISGGFGFGDVFPQLMAAHLVAVLGAFLALAGRWAVGTWTALAGVVAGIAVDVGRGADPGGSVFLFGGPLLALALVALLCPPDLRPAPRARTRTGVVAALAWTAVVAGTLFMLPLSYPLPELKFAVPMAYGLLLAGRQAFTRLRTAPAVLLAGLPLVFFGANPGGLDTLVLTGALGLLLAAAVVVSIRRRRSGPNPLAGG
ncbi:hypothetical protein [Streptomyces sp. NBC_01443]|uniref:hypothetical protein n=1 Tax=Streptomyces sp. NBC_01443 TaxID=2903868 RepID=UPI002256577D|nr:hypothetical protein [Streptomyces sp. NBC_01443]MCX4625369.1 hypothetical protein [Streptomyces sp. NBC_01443]